MIIDTNNPVFRMETRRQLSSKRLLALQRGCMPLLLMTTTVTMTMVAVPLILSRPWDGDIYITQLLGTTFSLLVFIQVLAGVGIAILTIAQSAPAISGEREVQSWDLLRTTTLPLQAIIAGKVVGTLVRLKMPLAAVFILRVVSGVTGLLFLISNLLRQSIFYLSPGDTSYITEQWLWLPGVILAVLLSLFYITQPLVQFTINTALGMFYSVLTTSRGRALAASLGARLFLWVVMGGVYFGGLRLTVGIIDSLSRASNPLLVTNFFIAQEVWLLFGTGIVAILIITAWQLGMILFMLGFVHRRAAQLEAA